MSGDGDEEGVLAALLKGQGAEGLRIVDEELKHRRRTYWVDLGERIFTRLLTASVIVFIVLVTVGLVVTGHTLEGGLIGLLNAAMAIVSAWGRGKSGGG